ncbi:MAG: class I lanthipeptide [Saprospiraceae bacterium]|nr:class I lanthipeptide [Saprospiraceae bacterium]
MKKLQLDPLDLQKETIALLDGRQLQEIIGGINNAVSGSGTSTGCGSGGSHCTIKGTSTGCGTGSSQCFAGGY